MPGRKFAVIASWCVFYVRMEDAKMPIEQNIPATIRNWAYCLVENQRYEAVVRPLDSGCRFSIGTHGICKSFVGRHGCAGKKKFLEEFCIPEAARLKRRCARYRALADRIRRNSAMPPERRLQSKDEA